MLIPEEAELFADSAHGIYIPQHFAKAIVRDYVTGITADDFAILETGPEHELYWDVWNDVLGNAVLHPPSGGDWYLWQDMDLWVVPEKPDPKLNIDRLLDSMHDNDIRELAAERILEEDLFDELWSTIDD